MPVTAFPGRILIDHLQKTGGQAIAAWLTKRLGHVCVAPNVIGRHHDLIRTLGGEHSIIAGHVEFAAGEPLDPRYQYVTCLREPIDRAVSWLYFVLYDAHETAHANILRKEANAFLETCGADCGPELLRSLLNPYTKHFAGIGSKRHAPSDPVASAFSVIQAYDVVGIYEAYREFVCALAKLIGIEPPVEVARVNVSSRRPSVEQSPPWLIDKFREFTEQDSRLYAQVVAWSHTKPGSAFNAATASRPAVWSHVTEANGIMQILRFDPQFEPGGRQTVSVQITNRTRWIWQSRPSGVSMASYHWLKASGARAVFDGCRSLLPPEGIHPGAQVEVNLTVEAPLEPGRYTLVLTLVEEGEFWFEQRGFEPAVVQAVVGQG